MIENTRYIIDRFEDEGAMLEAPDLSIITVPTTSLPEGAEEGDILLFTDGQFVRLESETAEHKKAILSKFERLKSKGKKK